MNGWPPSMGWPAAFALGALVLALTLRWGVAPAWQQQALDMRHAEARPAASIVAPAPEAHLPELGEPAERVADLLALALRHGIRVERTQQRLGVDAGVLRLQVTLAAHGSYADLRNYIADALRADPGLALDRLQWRRPTEATASLDAELQWSLLREQAGAREERP